MDRVLVFRDGVPAAELRREELTRSAIVREFFSHEPEERVLLRPRLRPSRDARLARLAAPGSRLGTARRARGRAADR